MTNDCLPGKKRVERKNSSWVPSISLKQAPAIYKRPSLCCLYRGRQIETCYPKNPPISQQQRQEYSFHPRRQKENRRRAHAGSQSRKLVTTADSGPYNYQSWWVLLPSLISLLEDTLCPAIKPAAPHSRLLALYLSACVWLPLPVLV